MTSTLYNVQKTSENERLISYDRSSQHMLNQSQKVMTCFEHQYLSVANFAQSQDFDYLIQKDLPCFKFEVKRGQIYLKVSHYLASVILPSGITLEILPKLSKGNINTITRTTDVVAARAWVKRMLSDIAIDELSKPMSAMDVGTIVKQHSAENSVFELVFPNIKSTQSTQSTTVLHSEIADRNSAQSPWYKGILNLAKDKIVQACSLLPNRYQRQIHNQPRSQGKLNLSAQLKINWHRPHYLYSEKSQLAVNDDLADFLMTGWQQLSKLLNDHQLLTPAGIQNCSPLPVSQWRRSYQSLQRDRMSWQTQLSPAQREVLDEAIQWCWWLLCHSHCHQSAESEDGLTASATNTVVPALMINMNHAFERWVLGKLANWLGGHLPDSQLLIQPSMDWLFGCDEVDRHADTFNLQQVVQKLIPDACICDSQGKITHVIDIKYKAINKLQQITAADWQQLYVYQHHLVGGFSSAEAWLLYPMTENFTQRLDVVSKMEENNGVKQDRQQFMSAIPFDMHQGLLLI